MVTPLGQLGSQSSTLRPLRLWQSLKRQGRGDEAADVELRFHSAWVDADVDLTSSRF